MKKIIAIIFVIMLTLQIAGCGNKNPVEEAGVPTPIQTVSPSTDIGDIEDEVDYSALSIEKRAQDFDYGKMNTVEGFKPNKYEMSQEEAQECFKSICTEFLCKKIFAAKEVIIDNNTTTISVEESAAMHRYGFNASNVQINYGDKTYICSIDMLIDAQTGTPYNIQIYTDSPWLILPVDKDKLISLHTEYINYLGVECGRQSYQCETRNVTCVAADTKQLHEVLVEAYVVENTMIAFDIGKNGIIDDGEILVPDSTGNVLQKASDAQILSAGVTENEAAIAIKTEISELIEQEVIPSISIDDYEAACMGLYVAEFGDTSVMQNHYIFELTNDDEKIYVQINSESKKLMYLGTNALSVDDFALHAKSYAGYLNLHVNGYFRSYAYADYTAYYLETGVNEYVACGVRDGYFVIYRACKNFSNLGGNNQ